MRRLSSFSMNARSATRLCFPLGNPLHIELALPTTMSARKVVPSLLCVLLLCSGASANAWYQVGSSLPIDTPRGVSFNRDGGDSRRVAVSEASNQIRVFELNGTNHWTQLGSPIPCSRAFNTRHVALSGNFLVVGDVAANNYDGEVRGYEWTESSRSWQLLGSSISGSSGERAGLVVSASRTRTALDDGTPSSPFIKIAILSNSRIRAFTWTPSSNTWIQWGSDLPSPPSSIYAGSFNAMATDDSFWYIVVSDGYRIHRYGYVLCIGCTSGWSLLNTETHGLQWSGGACYDAYESLAMSSNGQRVAVGNPCADSAGVNAGTVQVYDFATSSSSQVGSDIYGNSANTKLGYTLAMSRDGTRIALGTFLPTPADSMPYVRMMEYHASTGWTQLGSDIQEPYFSVGTGGVDFFDGYSQSVAVTVVQSGSPNYIKIFKFGTAPPPPSPPPSPPPPSSLGSTSGASSLTSTFTFVCLVFGALGLV